MNRTIEINGTWFVLNFIEQIYRNPMSNNKRREIFYSVLDNPRCRVGKGSSFYGVNIVGR